MYSKFSVREAVGCNPVKSKIKRYIFYSWISVSFAELLQERGDGRQRGEASRSMVEMRLDTGQSWLAPSPALSTFSDSSSPWSFHEKPSIGTGRCFRVVVTVQVNEEKRPIAGCAGQRWLWSGRLLCRQMLGSTTPSHVQKDLCCISTVRESDKWETLDAGPRFFFKSSNKIQNLFYWISFFFLRFIDSRIDAAVKDPWFWHQKKQRRIK